MMMRKLVLTLIRLYQATLSPYVPGGCRFHPSCSRYAYEAIQRHGMARGGLLALRRLGRCHPWHPGGFDPVPELREPGRVGVMTAGRPEEIPHG